MRLGHFRTVWPSIFLASFLLAWAAPAQTFPEGFSRIDAVRELSDGRTLAFDGLEKRLLVLDWATGRVRDIGRRGDGPSEYQNATQLVPLPGDSTVLVDGLTRRWLLLHRDSILATLPQEQSLFLTQFFSPVFGGDADGHVIVTAAIPWTGSGERAIYSRNPAYADSLLVLRLKRDSRRIDTLTGLRGRPWGGVATFTRGRGREQMTYSARNPLAAPEQAIMLEDGTVAVARQHPFRIEFIARDGRRRLGPVIDSVRILASSRERQAAIAREWSFVPPPLPTEAEFGGWPDLVPSFPADALFYVPGNRLAVRRQPSVAAPQERIDVVDANGLRITQVRLSPGERVKAFGVRHVYLVRTDDDGFSILSRREW